MTDISSIEGAVRELIERCLMATGSKPLLIRATREVAIVIYNAMGLCVGGACFNGVTIRFNLPGPGIRLMAIAP